MTLRPMKIILTTGTKEFTPFVRGLRVLFMELHFFYASFFKK